MLCVCMPLALTACGGSGGDDEGQMKLSVADAPVDGATAVVVTFTGVELTRDDATTIPLSPPKRIDLLNQSGTASAVLFDQPIPSGDYQQIRLQVIADGDPANSYITLSDGSVHGLRIPSGSETGLKLVSGFEVPNSGVVAYTIDFDLRKAITCPPGLDGVCLLKPALRLVNDASVGNIQGVVAAAQVPVGCAPGVYLYTETGAAPEDINSTDTNGGQPIASKVPAVSSTSGGGYYYQFTFLPPGAYTVAYTCQASLDDPDLADPAVVFTSVVRNVGVTAAQSTTVNIP